MHEIVIISGKGGAGKTSITGAFANLAKNAILCDLDVDAPDLHLLLSPKVFRSEPFKSGNEAHIDPDKCTQCGICESMCRFNAIKENGGAYSVSPLHCEGCKVCVAFCPSEAIDFPQRHCGTWHESETRFGPMIHAQLFPGQENSGRLVTLLKQRARERAVTEGYDIILSDGAPGIGCPVISSLAGTDLAVIVTEPTPSGLHDLERVVQLCTRFRTLVTVLINKCDLNDEMTAAIETYCQVNSISIICKFPHTHAVTKAMVEGKVVTETGKNTASSLLDTAWHTILNQLNLHNPRSQR